MNDRDVVKFCRHWFAEGLVPILMERFPDPEERGKIGAQFVERLLTPSPEPPDPSYYGGVDPGRMDRHIARTLIEGGGALRTYLAPPDDAALTTHAWDTARHMIAAGDPPTAGEVAALLRNASPPPDLMAFVADTLEGKVSQRTGPKRPTMGDWFVRAVTAHRVSRWRRVFERVKQRTGRSSDPYREALAKVAAETGRAEATLDKWCYPRS
ncbi:MAG: hypothetical protein M3418_12495 [Gemmatimonadota bacterium]|nr:hypothetical protein [Gemmatimonadota bacterium]